MRLSGRKDRAEARAQARAMPCDRPPLFDPVLADDLVSETLARSPARAAVFIRRGMACPDCDMAGFMTLREAAKTYQIELESLLDELGEL